MQTLSVRLSKQALLVGVRSRSLGSSSVSGFLERLNKKSLSHRRTNEVVPAFVLKYLTDGRRLCLFALTDLKTRQGLHCGGVMVVDALEHFCI